MNIDAYRWMMTAPEALCVRMPFDTRPGAGEVALPAAHHREINKRVVLIPA